MASTGILEKIEGYLYRRGFEQKDARILVRNQLFMAGLSCLAAVLVGWLYQPVFDFAAGTLLVTWNFYCLAKLVQRHLKDDKGAVLRQLASFYLRLLVTGVALYVLMVWAQSNIWTLVAGLSTVVASALIWGFSRMGGNNAKEA